MNRVVVNAEEVPLPAWNKALKRYARKVLSVMGKKKWDLAFLLCGDRTITALNSQFRGKDEATDILSFSPGDIAISLDTLRENARSYRINEDEELRRLVIHGILHLDGMEHQTNTEDEPMLQFQEYILEKLSGEYIMGRNA